MTSKLLPGDILRHRFTPSMGKEAARGRTPGSTARAPFHLHPLLAARGGRRSFSISSRLRSLVNCFTSSSSFLSTWEIADPRGDLQNWQNALRNPGPLKIADPGGDLETQRFLTRHFFKIFGFCRFTNAWHSVHLSVVHRAGFTPEASRGDFQGAHPLILPASFLSQWRPK